MTDEQIASAPILILGNKIDLPGAASEDEIRHLFGLHSLTTGKVASRLAFLNAFVRVDRVFMLPCYLVESCMHSYEILHVGLTQLNIVLRTAVYLSMDMSTCVTYVIFKQ